MNEQQENLLRRYVDAVLKAPAHLHLTADRDPTVFWARHVQDAVHLLGAIPPSQPKKTIRVVDVGSGNGVPGIPMAILQPDWEVTLLDSDNKKCGFLDMFLNLYAIKNARVVCDRAEKYAHLEKEMYDLVTARALGKLSVALELGAAFLKPGGLLIVPHGTSWELELKKTMKASDFLGLTFLEAKPYALDHLSFVFLIYKKVKDTPGGYPRSIGTPAKRPL